MGRVMHQQRLHGVSKTVRAWHSPWPTDLEVWSDLTKNLWLAYSAFIKASCSRTCRRTCGQLDTEVGPPWFRQSPDISRPACKPSCCSTRHLLPHVARQRRSAFGMRCMAQCHAVKGNESGLLTGVCFLGHGRHLWCAGLPFSTTAAATWTTSSLPCSRRCSRRWGSRRALHTQEPPACALQLTHIMGTITMLATAATAAAATLMTHTSIMQAGAAGPRQPALPAQPPWPAPTPCTRTTPCPWRRPTQVWTPPRHRGCARSAGLMTTPSSRCSCSGRHYTSTARRY